MRKLTLRPRSVLAMAAIIISTSAVASAQYKFMKVNVPGALRTMPAGKIVGSYTTGTVQLSYFGLIDNGGN